MANCNYKVNNKDFTNLKDLTAYLASLQFNEPTPEKMTQEAVVKMLTDAGKKIDFVDRKMVDGLMTEAHDYNYGNQKLKPVSQLISEKYNFLGGPAGEVGLASKDYGTEFHALAELTINTINNGKTLDILKKDKLNIQKKWIDQVAKMYEGWSDGGKNKVLTEFRIGNIKQGVAGTIDVAVVFQDGSIALHDFKGTSSEYVKSSEASISKRRSNNFQMNLYQRMLEVGDTELGLKPMVVRDSGSIIPIEFKIDGDGKLTDIDVKENLKYREAVVFTFQKQNRAIAKTMFPVEGSDMYMKRIKSSQIAGWNEFLYEHTGFQFEKSAFEDGAARIAGRAKKNKDGIYAVTIGKQNIIFKDPVAAYNKDQAGLDARIHELSTMYKDMLSSRRSAPAKDLENFINFGVPINFQLDNQYSPDVDRLKKLTRIYKPNVDHAVLAKDIEGLEGMGDDTVIIFKGRNNLTGSFSSVDIITLNSDVDGGKTKPLRMGTTIAGNFIKDSQTRTVAQQAGKHHVKLWVNNRENAEMLKMGLIALHLKKENPDITVDSLVNATMSVNEAPKNLGHNMTEVLDQLNVLASIKVKGKHIIDMTYGADTKIPAMLKDKELMNSDKYLGSNLETYIRWVARTLTQDVTQSHNTRKQNENVKKWVENPANKDIFTGIFSDAGLAMTLKAVAENEELKKQITNSLSLRMKNILKVLDGIDKAKDDPEFQYVAKAYLEMRGISTDFSTFHELGMSTRDLITPGMSGIEIVDDLISTTQRTIGEMNREFYSNFIVKSKKMHQKLMEDSSALGKQVLGNTGDIYYPMMEHQDFDVKDQKEKKVNRPTGRFWPKGTAEYNRLTKVQKEYIDWFNTNVREALVFGMDEDQVKKFDEYWRDGFIPVLIPSVDTRFTDIMKGKDSEGNFIQKLNEWFDTSLSMYNSRDGIVESQSHNFEKIVDKLERQKKFDGDSDEQYGDVRRMKHLGLTADGQAEVTYTKPGDKKGEVRDITRTMETNLESVLAFTMLNKYRQDYLGRAVEDFEAGKAAIVMINSSRFEDQDPEQILKYLKSWSDRNLFQKMQISKEQEGLARTLKGARTIASAAFLDYNMLSQAKNAIAGFYHTLSTGIANPKLGKKLPAAYAFIINPANAGLVSSLMWQMGLANADSEQLIHGVHAQLGRRGFTSSHWKNFLNYHGDFFHRSVFMVANMMKDGTLDAYTVVKDTGDGPSHIYDESKDPRFKGDEGKAFKAALTEQLKKEDKIKDGKLLRAYSSYEIQAMKTEANEAFEAQNTEEQVNFMNGLPGILFGQFRGWWMQKYKRYAMVGGQMDGRKTIKTVAITDPKTGKVTYTAHYEGEYMEGIYYTVLGLAGSFKAAFDTHDLTKISDYYGSMSEHQVSNIRRLAGDFALLAGLIALGGLFFDDEDENDSAWYYLWYKSAYEINLMEYVKATPIFGTGSSAASIGFFQNIATDPVKTLTNPGFVKPFTKDWGFN